MVDRKQNIKCIFEKIILIVLNILLILLLCSSFTLFCYYFFVFKISLCYSKEKQGEAVGVSVIICGHNAANFLEKNIPLVCQQIYSDYEVIVVNDASYDNTDEVMTALMLEYEILKYIKIETKSNAYLGKKNALLQGVKASKHGVLLLTDADCIPSSAYWISEMSSKMIDTIEVVLGYGDYENDDTFLNDIIKAETFYTALLYGSFAIKGLPYMGVGRNVMYQKKFFYSQTGLEKFKQLRSGDDDLLLQSAMNAKNTAVQFAPASHTISTAPNTWRDWYLQKKRHLSTSYYYPKRIIVLLLLFNANVMLFVVCSFFIVLYSLMNQMWLLQPLHLIVVTSCNALLMILCDTIWLEQWRYQLTHKHLQTRDKKRFLNLFQYSVYLLIHLFTLVLPNKNTKW